MLKLNKEQTDVIYEAISDVMDTIIENATVEDFKQLLEFIQEYGYVEKEKEKMFEVELLKMDSNKSVDEYIEEYKVKLNMPCYKESYLLEFNQIVEKILDKSTYCYSVEEAKLVKDLMKLSKKYKKEIK